LSVVSLVASLCYVRDRGAIERIRAIFDEFAERGNPYRCRRVRFHEREFCGKHLGNIHAVDCGLHVERVAQFADGRAQQHRDLHTDGDVRRGIQRSRVALVQRRSRQRALRDFAHASNRKRVGLGAIHGDNYSQQARHYRYGYADVHGNVRIVDAQTDRDTCDRLMMTYISAIQVTRMGSFFGAKTSQPISRNWR
jgi:hypothetical protein